MYNLNKLNLDKAETAFVIILNLVFDIDFNFIYHCSIMKQNIDFSLNYN